MKTLVNLLAFALVAFSSCHKPDAVPDTSGCLEGKISTFKNTSFCADAKVDQYVFQGRTVYVFEPGTCGADLSAGVIDANCNALGELGGFAGNTKINGEDFSNATYIKTVWKK